MADSKAIIPNTNTINIVQILQAKAEQIIKQKVKIIYEQENAELGKVFITKVLSATKEIIGQHTSKSEIYAKKKAVKLALDYLLKIESESELFKSIESRKIAEENRKENTDKKQIAVKHQQFLEEKREKRKLEMEIKTK